MRNSLWSFKGNDKEQERATKVFHFFFPKYSLQKIQRKIFNKKVEEKISQLGFRNDYITDKGAFYLSLSLSLWLKWHQKQTISIWNFLVIFFTRAIWFVLIFVFYGLKFPILGELQVTFYTKGQRETTKSNTRRCSI